VLPLRSAANPACISPMKALAALVFLTLASLHAEELHISTLMTGFSPKLRKLLDANPKALTLISNSCSLIFRTNTVALHYFYTEDESVPRAQHYYPSISGEADVVICVRENQQPWDEFTCITYEMLNSKNESRLEAVMEKAKAGSISKKDFARDILRIEFETDLAVRDILKGMKLTEKEKAESYFYKRLTECPTDFEESLAYARKVSPKRDAVKEYELKYDEIRANKN
jgi:hypothetical protein